jgi:hypothetical protein
MILIVPLILPMQLFIQEASRTIDFTNGLQDVRAVYKLNKKDRKREVAGACIQFLKSYKSFSRCHLFILCSNRIIKTKGLKEDENSGAVK